MHFCISVCFYSFKRNYAVMLSLFDLKLNVSGIGLNRKRAVISRRYVYCNFGFSEIYAGILIPFSCIGNHNRQSSLVQQNLVLYV